MIIIVGKKNIFHNPAQKLKQRVFKTICTQFVLCVSKSSCKFT